MNKKSIFIFFSIINILLFSQEPVFIKTEAPKTLCGNEFFPLFLGAKWKWSLELFGNKTDVNWEIKDVLILNDIKNNLSDIIVFKTECPELEFSWYFMEYQDYICRFDKENEKWIIEKFLPLKPKNGDTWEVNNRINTISNITDDFLKVDVKSNDNSNFGYKIFKKNVGLYEIYELETRGIENYDTKWTLKSYLSFDEKMKSDYNNIIAKNPLIINQETSNTEIQISEPIITPQEIFNNNRILNLEKNKSYVQIGSFSAILNAVNYFEKIKNKGYKIFFYLDKDNMYKILIEVTEGNDDDFLKKVRNDINSKAFMKQRKLK